MQRLDIGKAFEDGRHHHGTICSKTHCQAEGLHTCEHCACAWCNPSLQCTKFNKIDHTLNSTSLQSEQNGTTGGSRSTMMTVPPISSILGTLVLCWVQISQYAQLGGNSNLDPGARATGRVGISPDFPQDKPVETGGVHHSDALHYGSADLHAPEAPADETQPLDGPLEVEDLQHGAPGDEGVDVPVLHDDAARCRRRARGGWGKEAPLRAAARGNFQKPR